MAEELENSTDEMAEVAAETVEVVAEPAPKAAKPGKAPKAAALKAEKANLVAVRLVRSHWIGEYRHDAPETLEVEPAEARRLVDAGVAARTDPIPGE